MAQIKIGLGYLYFDLNRDRESELAYLEALNIYQNLAKENASKFQPEVANVLLLLGGSYSQWQNFQKADSSILLALEIYQKLCALWSDYSIKHRNHQQNA